MNKISIFLKSRLAIPLINKTNRIGEGHKKFVHKNIIKILYFKITIYVKK